MVDLSLFDSAWAEMKKDDRQGRSAGITPPDREHVYWGRIAHRVIPSRTKPSLELAELTNAVRRSLGVSRVTGRPFGSTEKEWTWNPTPFGP